jgi:hypothetical protein
MTPMSEPEMTPPVLAPARPRDGRRGLAGGRGRALAERELTALWLLGRVPEDALPWPLLRPGRAGRGPGPDVREACFLTAGGVPRAGDVEVHLRASDFARHGHHRDPAYDGVLLHLVWDDDQGEPVRLASGRRPPTVAAGPALGDDPRRLRALLRLGPRGVTPCAQAARRRPAGGTVALVRAEGRKRLAERVWRAARLAAEAGWSGAWERLLDGALRSSRRRPAGAGEGRVVKGRVAQGGASGAGHSVDGEEPWRTLAALAHERRPGRLIDALRGGEIALPERLGRGRAAEVGWNAALPLLAALASAHGDVELARCTAALAGAWPAPRPYGRTRALGEALSGDGNRTPRGGGALWAQGLLHLQELWCERGGCGVCPLSSESPPPAGNIPPLRSHDSVPRYPGMGE